MIAFFMGMLFGTACGVTIMCLLAISNEEKHR